MVYLKVLAVFAFITWFPGYLVTRLFRINIQERLSAFIFLPAILGLPATTLVYFVSRLFNFEQYAFLFPVLCFFSCLVVWIKNGLPRVPFTISGVDIRNGIIFAGLLALMLGVFYSYNVSRTHYDSEGGFVVGDDAYSDNLWSISVASEIKNHVPPRSPILSGYRLRYHYLGDLFSDFVYKLSGINLNMLEFSFKVIPPCYLLLLFGALYLSLTQSFGKRWIAFLSIALLALLPVRTSLFFKHHDTLAIIYFFTAVFYLLDSYYRGEEKKKGYLCAAFFLLGILPLHDAVFGATVNGTVFLYAFFDSIKSRRVKPLLIASVSGLAFGALVYISALGWPASHVSSFAFTKGPMISTAHNYFKPYFKAMKIVFEMIPGIHSTAGNIFTQGITGLAYVFFTVLSYALPGKMSLEYTLMALPFCFLILFKPDKYPKVWQITAWIALLGALLPAVVGYKKGPAEGLVTMRALEFSQMLLVPFTVIAIHYLWTERKLLGKFVVCILLFFYTWPRFMSEGFYLKSYYYSYIDKDKLQVLNFLRDQTPVSSIVLHPFKDNPIYEVGKKREAPSWIFEGHYYYVSAIGERQAVLEGAPSSTTYFMGGASPEEVMERVSDVEKFYSTSDRQWAKSFLDRHEVNYVWVPRKKLLKFDTRSLLMPVLENEQQILYHVDNFFPSTSQSRVRGERPPI